MAQWHLAFSGGSLKFISKATASASASIEFTSGIDSSYNEYVFYFVNMHPATHGTGFRFQGSSDGGSSYGVSLTSTYFQAYVNEAGTIGAALIYANTRDLANSTGDQLLNDGITGNDADSSYSGVLRIFNPASTTYVKHFISEGTSMWDLTGPMNSYVGGYFNSLSALNAFRFKMTSGNIDSGEILLFGVS
jgi:hypothetical protein